MVDEGFEEPKDGSSANPQSKATWMQFAGAGLELAGSALVVGGLGWLVDWFLETETPYGLAAGLLVGFGLGMVRFIIQVSRAG